MDSALNILYLKCPGFGDKLYKPLFSALSQREIRPIWEKDPLRQKTQSILTCGSIINCARSNDYVYGTGTLHFDKTERLLEAKNLNIYTVRGPLCRKYILDNGGNKCPEIYIDPGVLFAIYFGTNCTISKNDLIGVIPHTIDYDKLSKIKLPPKYILINAKDDPMIVLAKIQKCSRIISSSLHGIIVAESLRIPAAWVEFSDLVKSGGMKFYDYFQGSGRKASDIARNDLRREIDFTKVIYNPPATYMFKEGVNAAPDWLIHPVQKQFLIEKFECINR